jgi:hypothetical protein
MNIATTAVHDNNIQSKKPEIGFSGRGIRELDIIVEESNSVSPDIHVKP